MARVAKALLVRPRVCATPSERGDVVDDIAGHFTPCLQALSAKGLFVQHCCPVALTSSSPFAGILVRWVACPSLTLACPTEDWGMRWQCYFPTLNDGR